ncbi:hypothetical protein [Alienimonas chondri]|uniref:Uncharacterized protein n=1 Tax=Alienimonas chondri TaxID=2681879 RepID=A0ABX1VH90_9PLAN|nr:hypothetical protein [Alienimonas chondri]NNJ27240.1 hypothetical protein [Alienimonas chondri]
MPTPTLEELDEQLIVAILELDEAKVADLVSQGASVTCRRKRTATSVGTSHTPLLLTGTLESAINDQPDSEFRKVPRTVVRLCRDAGGRAVGSLGRQEALRRLQAIRIEMMSHVDGPLLG